MLGWWWERPNALRVLGGPSTSSSERVAQCLEGNGSNKRRGATSQGTDGPYGELGQRHAPKEGTEAQEGSRKRGLAEDTRKCARMATTVWCDAHAAQCSKYGTPGSVAALDPLAFRAMPQALRGCSPLRASPHQHAGRRLVLAHLSILGAHAGERAVCSSPVRKTPGPTHLQLPTIVLARHPGFQPWEPHRGCCK